MRRPDTGFGMRHVALFVRDLDACIAFYTGLMGMEVEWRPDAHNIYLTTGSDSLALHQAATDHVRDERAQRLDHIGFLQKHAADVDGWFEFLREHGVKMRSEPLTRDDGSRCFYCYDPDGTVIQIIHHPPEVDWAQIRGVN